MEGVGEVHVRARLEQHRDYHRVALISRVAKSRSIRPTYIDISPRLYQYLYHRRPSCIAGCPQSITLVRIQVIPRLQESLDRGRVAFRCRAQHRITDEPAWGRIRILPLKHLHMIPDLLLQRPHSPHAPNRVFVRLAHLRQVQRIIQVELGQDLAIEHVRQLRDDGVEDGDATASQSSHDIRLDRSLHHLPRCHRAPRGVGRRRTADSSKSKSIPNCLAKRATSRSGVTRTHRPRDGAHRAAPRTWAAARPNVHPPKPIRGRIEREDGVGERPVDPWDRAQRGTRPMPQSPRRARHIGGSDG